MCCDDFPCRPFTLLRIQFLATGPGGVPVVRANGLGEAKSTQRFNLCPVRARALTVGQVSALSDFDDIAVRIADVAAYLAVLGYRLGDKLRASIFP